MSLKIVLACGAALSLAAGAAQAEEFTINFGAKASVSPPYEGANHFVVRPTPTFSLVPADRPYRFTPSDSGTTFALIDSRYVAFGPMARFQYGRGDRGSLAGLDRVHWAAEPGAFLDLWPTRWFRAHGELRRGVIGHAGLVSDVGADLVYQGQALGLLRRPAMGVRRQGLFPALFRRDAPGGGAQSGDRHAPTIPAAASATPGSRWTPPITWTAGSSSGWGVGFHDLTAKAADSPIVRLAGEREQYTAGVGLSWSFNVGH